jgi:hypothetical protein
MLPAKNASGNFYLLPHGVYHLLSVGLHLQVITFVVNLHLQTLMTEFNWVSITWPDLHYECTVIAGWQYQGTYSDI